MKREFEIYKYTCNEIIMQWPYVRNFYMSAKYHDIKDDVRKGIQDMIDEGKRLLIEELGKSEEWAEDEKDQYLLDWDHDSYSEELVAEKELEIDDKDMDEEELRAALIEKAEEWYRDTISEMPQEGNVRYDLAIEDDTLIIGDYADEDLAGMRRLPRR